MSDEIKKINDEIKNIENTQEGAISDDAAEAVAGGRELPNLPDDQRRIDIVKTASTKNR